MNQSCQQTWPREMLRGAVEGAVYGGVGLALFIMVSMTRGGAVRASDLPYMVPTFVLAATIICAVGRGISGRYLGSLLGAFAGLFLVGWTASVMTPINSLDLRQIPPVAGFILGAFVGAVLEKYVRAHSGPA